MQLAVSRALAEATGRDARKKHWKDRTNDPMKTKGTICKVYRRFQTQAGRL